MPKEPLNSEVLDDRSRILVVVNTCSRPDLVRLYLGRIMDCVAEVAGADLVLAIDGLSEAGNQKALDIALSLGVNAIVSDQAEGVGVSKNRVMDLLGGYEFYFFIDDDVEVLSSRLFSEHVELHEETGIHHFSLHDPRRLLAEGSPTYLDGNQKIRHAMYGGAAVNFFTRTALGRVGGWHSSFAKLRRGGHTEHSYRVYRSGLCPAPFNLIDGLAACCIWRDPPPVVRYDEFKIGDNGLFEMENDLISENIQWFPFYAGSPGRIVRP